MKDIHSNEFRPTRWPWLQSATEANHFWLFDPRRIAGPPVPLSLPELAAVNLSDGKHTIVEIHSLISIRFGRYCPTLNALVELFGKLDQGHFFNSLTFRDYVNGPLRRPSCIGCYPEEPEAIHKSMDELFTGSDGPGLPDKKLSNSSHIRGIITPHIDYARGGVTYGHAFKPLAEQTDANLFVIIGTSHYSSSRFTLSRMNFETPLGVVETDQVYIDRLVEYYGTGLFDDPLAHLPEHSIELEVVILQHLFADRQFRIVPLLVGSFVDCISSHIYPKHVDEIARMIAALQQAEHDAGETICYIISGDLAHIGPKFGDESILDANTLKFSRDRDKLLLQAIETASPDLYFQAIQQEQDVRRVCGFPPAYLAMSTLRPSSGQVLHYQQYADEQGHESVSFAAAAFYD